MSFSFLLIVEYALKKGFFWLESAKCSRTMREQVAFCIGSRGNRWLACRCVLPLLVLSFLLLRGPPHGSAAFAANSRDHVPQPRGPGGPTNGMPLFNVPRGMLRGLALFLELRLGETIRVVR